MSPREYGPPEQVAEPTLADHLAVMTKAAFQSGMSWDVIESKWDAFLVAFHDFDPGRVADLAPDDVDDLASNPKIIRNRKKIEATIHNAEELLELEEATDGGYDAWLASQGDFDATVKALRKRFKFLGEFGCFYYLYVVKQPVPSYEEWRAAHGRS